jgi:hypothetical protein
LNLSDGNVRRLLKIIYSILDGIPRGEKIKIISEEKQHQAITAYANDEIEVVKSLVSEDGYSYFFSICKKLQLVFYSQLFSRHATSFYISKNDVKNNEVIIKKLIWYGRLIPERYEGESLSSSGKIGEIGYLFATPFWLILRKGNPIDINYAPQKTNNSSQLTFEEMGNV